MNASRRTHLLQLLAASTSLSLLVDKSSAATTSEPAAAPAAGEFDVLKRPALQSRKAAGAAMLAVAKAGSRLVAVGERGVVLLSDDNGKSWRQVEIPVSVTLTAVHFPQPTMGWAVGHLGVILHSADAGLTWKVQLDGLRAAALAVDSAKSAGGEASTRLVAAAQALVEDGPDKPFLDVYFQNAQVGYAVGAYNLAFRTDDGGRTWVSWMGRMDNPKGLHLYAIRPAAGGLLIAGEQGLLLRSVDGGQTFTASTSPSKGSFFGMLAGSGGEVLLFGLRGRAFLSTDGVRSWTEIETGTKTSLGAATQMAEGAVVLASQSGELLLSRDGGRSFKPAATGVSLPVTAMLPTSEGRLLVASLRGMRTVAAPAA